jgi:methylglyoxal synthase
MQFQRKHLPAQKTIALVAHDNMKDELLAWAQRHHQQLGNHRLCATGTTGRLLTEHLQLPVDCLMSGPLGGDQQIGAGIAEGRIDLLVFFWDPLCAQPHDPDVKALLRIAALWNIPVACNEASADMMFSSTLLDVALERRVPDYSDYLNSRT